MTHRMRELAEQIVRLQSELDREIESRRKQLGWSLKEGLLRFEHGIAAEHRRFKMGAAQYLARLDDLRSALRQDDLATKQA